MTLAVPGFGARPRGRGTADATAGELVYAVGDVHGRYDLFRPLLAALAEDAVRAARGRDPLLILCGDLIDRGPGSAEMLEAVLWLEQHGPFELHALMGNHERGCLDFLADPVTGERWLDYGGAETLLSYGVAPPDAPEPEALIATRDALLARMPAAHLLLLQRLELIVEVGDYVFVHAGIRPGTALTEQAERDLLWIRRDFLDSEATHPKVVVHGHSWQDDALQLRRNRIGIDTGAFATDVLTALRLDGATRASARTGPGGTVRWDDVPVLS